MKKALFEHKVLAQSDSTIKVEGNDYFPASTIHYEFLKRNDHHTECPWKGRASYFDVEVGNKVLKNGAWTYPSPKHDARAIAEHIAFDKSVEVKKT